MPTPLLLIPVFQAVWRCGSGEPRSFGASMSRTIVAVLAGLLVAVAIGAGLNLLLASAGASPLGATWVVGLGVGSFVAAGVMNAGGRKRASKADAGEKAAALRSPPPAGMARLTVFRDGAIGSRNGSDLFLDGREVVQLLGNQFVSVTLPPGQHTLRVALAGAANAGSKAAELALDLTEGAVTAIRVTLAMKMTTSDVVLTSVDAGEAAAKLSGRTMVTAH